MTDRPTTVDIMATLEALRGDVGKLLNSHDDHERRIAELESLRSQVQRLHDHLASISRETTTIHELLSGTELGVTSALRLAGRDLTTNVTAMVRAEIGGLRAELAALTKSLDSRPCVAGAPCLIAEDTKE